MAIISPLTLLIAAVLASPALYGAFVTHELEMEQAATRYLIAVVVSMVMLSLLRAVTKNYRNPKRRSTDQDEPDKDQSN